MIKGSKKQKEVRKIFSESIKKGFEGYKSENKNKKRKKSQKQKTKKTCIDEFIRRQKRNVRLYKKCKDNLKPLEVMKNEKNAIRGTNKTTKQIKEEYDKLQKNFNHIIETFPRAKIKPSTSQKIEKDYDTFLKRYKNHLDNVKKKIN